MTNTFDFLADDHAQTDALLREVCAQTSRILANLPTQPVAGGLPPAAPTAHGGANDE